MPAHDGHFYGGQWRAPLAGRYFDVVNPATQAVLGRVADGCAQDADAAMRAARAAFPAWRALPIFRRAAILRQAAEVLRAHDKELALLDALNCGNPVSEMVHDVHASAAMLEYFAGLIPELKGDTIPMNNGSFDFTLREPLGVVVRIYPSNHPLLFAASRIAAALAAGNTVVIKPPEQAPLSSIRMMELLGEVFPAGVLNCVNGGRDTGAALVSHPLVAKIALTGGENAGKAVLRAAAEQIKPALLELGGKNALLVYPDADLEAAVGGAVRGMNFLWAGQSCGSTSRIYVHEDLYDAFVDKLAQGIAAAHKPGLPEDPETTMGCLGSKAAFDKTMHYIDAALQEGARLVTGGKRPDDPALAKGWFVEPTVFADVRSDMRVAREEIFGPVVVVIRWRDEGAMMEEVNALDYGLTCSIWTRDLDTALNAAHRVEAGYVWINGSSSHAIGAPFGGYKRSGLGREECLEELLAFTQVKNVNVARMT
ncbi:aldehyde dehydrogenase family protein [Pigmentiphaga soli]|uniref:Aldehyde dehydrogenase family protein n=2 Tax=Pigmentiphaga soli TaxID=1007095 RepID=A0ABP8HAW2_9BURK